MAVKVCPAIVTVPLRVLPVAFSLTSNVTRALPLPLLAEVRVIQPTSLVAVQLHPAGAVTLTLPSPPLAGKTWLVGERVPEHEEEDGGCMTNTCSSTRANENKLPSGE